MPATWLPQGVCHTKCMLAAHCMHSYRMLTHASSTPDKYLPHALHISYAYYTLILEFAGTERQVTYQDQHYLGQHYCGQHY